MKLGRVHEHPRSYATGGDVLVPFVVVHRLRYYVLIIVGAVLLVGFFVFLLSRLVPEFP
jgi:hypothetical protein